MPRAGVGPAAIVAPANSFERADAGRRPERAVCGDPMGVQPLSACGAVVRSALRYQRPKLRVASLAAIG